MSLTLTPRRSAIIAKVWRLLCQLACMSAVAACVALWGILPSWLVGVSLAPGMLVTLVIVVAWFADSTGSSTSRVASIGR